MSGGPLIDCLLNSSFEVFLWVLSASGEGGDGVSERVVKRLSTVGRSYGRGVRGGATHEGENADGREESPPGRPVFRSFLSIGRSCTEAR